MPIYEYLCNDSSCCCTTEKTCKFQERFDAPDCERCGGPTHQIISGSVAVHLKAGGVGWADTGYSGAAPKKEKP